MSNILSIEQYIEQFDGVVYEKLSQINQYIKQNFPNMTPYIGYGMPAYKIKHSIIYFAANKVHIGIYPHNEAIRHFADELKPYKTSKGAFQIPYHIEIPFELIGRVIAFNINLFK